MTRKPVDQAGAPRDAIWAAVRMIGGAGTAFTVSDIAAQAQAKDKTVRDYLKGLTASGYLHQDNTVVGFEATRWVLARDIGNEAPRVRADGSPVTQGTITEQLWRGMYMLKEFTFEDLIETATVEIPVDTAKAYCKMLLTTGYLRVLRKAEPTSGRIARYRLIRFNGPKPPQIQRVKRVYDPNSREVFMPGAQA
ncbi:hypothetical protein [Gemmobacter serpentinus]|uniref:hypothetical protein n=1 Tax=Gemmobacter serpentinus TaxID=2652247 RepID=UPI00124BE810|nr:hypothetical protein [Gemmobacter serpentinus]